MTGESQRFYTRTKAVLDELANIQQGQPLWPGDTISHPTARACQLLGWSERDADGNHVLTARGAAVLAAHRGDG